MERNKGFADSKIVDFPTTVTTPCAPRLLAIPAPQGDYKMSPQFPFAGRWLFLFFVFSSEEATTEGRQHEMSEAKT